MRVSALAVLAVVGLTWADGAGGAQEAGCSSVPVAVVAGGPDAPGSPGTNRVHAYGDFPFPTASGPDLTDIDGDTYPDEVRVGPDGSVSFELVGGDVRFAIPGATLWAGGVGRQPLEGPGDAIVVFETEDLVDATDLPDGRSWIVRDPLEAGTYDPREVGVEVDGGAAFTGPDRDGDGVDDLLLVSYDGDPHRGETRVVSGAAVDAAVPGTAVAASATIEVVPGVLDGFARIDGEDLSDPDGPYRREGRLVTRLLTPGGWELRVSDGSVVRTYVSAPLAPTDLPPGVAVFAWVADEGPYLSASPDSSTYWWDLDTCTAAPPSGTPGPPPAPAAEPITAVAELTG
jgi:hypothetical protein